MKRKDYFSKLKTQGKIENEEFDKFIEALEDADIPDSVVALIEEKFMTRERAATDKALRAQVGAEFYNAIDSNIHAILPELDGFDAKDIHEEKDTHKKLKLLKAGFKKAMDAAKKPTDSDKVNQENLKTISELTERFNALDKEKAKILTDRDEYLKTELEKRDREHEQFKVRHDLAAKIANIELAREYNEDPQIREDVRGLILDKILKNNVGYLNGQLSVHEIVDGAPKPKFIPGTNDLVTIDKLIETETARYIKRNNADPVDNTQRQQRTVVQSEPQKGQTLAQKRAALAMSDQSI